MSTVAPAPVPRAKPAEALRWTHDERPTTRPGPATFPAWSSDAWCGMLLVPNRTDYYLDRGEPKASRPHMPASWGGG